MNLTEWLEVLTTAAGAGALATWLMSYLRATFAPPATVPTAWYVRAGYLLLYAPRYTRGLVLVLTLLIGAGASFGLAALTGSDPEPAISALGAFVVSQLIHAATGLSAQMPQRLAP